MFYLVTILQLLQIAGPLVGRVVAAQMGYLPSIWLFSGRCYCWSGSWFFIVLFLSLLKKWQESWRDDKKRIGGFTGAVAMIGIFYYAYHRCNSCYGRCKSLANYALGLFTIAMTVQSPFLWGYMRF